jgi:ABC-2 type transport system permease protein
MTARILDRGYRRYSGERTGVPGAVRTVWLHSLQRALGIRRSAWAKVLPVLMIAISYIPAIVFIGIVAFVPKSDFNGTERATGFVLPTYGSYFGFIISALVLFVAFVGPEILCPDRRTGMLGVYLASPLSRDTYLLGKAMATATVLATVTIGPPLLMLVAFVLQGNGPNGPVGVVVALLRIIGAGLSITVIYTSFSMGMSSLTDRKAFATAGLILFFFMSNVLYLVLHQVLRLGADSVVIDIFVFPLALVEKIHGESRNYPHVSVVGVVLGAIVWTGVWSVVCRVRYQTLTVTK